MIQCPICQSYFKTVQEKQQDKQSTRYKFICHSCLTVTIIVVQSDMWVTFTKMMIFLDNMRLDNGNESV